LCVMSLILLQLLTEGHLRPGAVYITVKV
jgi:hypothetical protein